MGRTKEDRWLRCRNPETMLKLLGRNATARKLRLFACACCRRVWGRITDEGSQKAVEVAERHADHRATDEELRLAHIAADLVANAKGRADPGASWDVASATSQDPDPLRTTWMTRETAAYDSHADYTALEARRKAEAVAQLAIGHDLFGNPFRPVSINPEWQTPTIVLLAQAAYDNRILPAGTLENDRLAILADALEEAGCANADLLNHLRQPGDHVRGCWAVDLLLGKQ
jgi:hypothetical protein